MKASFLDWNRNGIARIVRGDETVSEREMEILQGLLSWSNVSQGFADLPEDVCIHYSTVKHKSEEVLVELPGLAPNVVVVSQLISVVKGLSSCRRQREGMQRM